MYLNNMININKNLFSLLLFFFVLISPNTTFAVGTGGAPGPGGGNTDSIISVSFTNPLNCGDKCTLMGLITLVLNKVVMPIAAVAVVLYIIWAGFMFVRAQGNPKKIEEARDNLLWALIGAGVLLGSAAIAEVVKRTVESLK